LGEFFYWWGVYLVNFSAGILWTIICPILFSFSILFVTGVAPLEKTMNEEYGERYEDYQKRVPIFFPLPFFGASKGKAMTAKGDDGFPQGQRQSEEKVGQRKAMEQNVGQGNRQKVQ